MYEPAVPIPSIDSWSDAGSPFARSSGKQAQELAIRQHIAGGEAHGADMQHRGRSYAEQTGSVCSVPGQAIEDTLTSLGRLGTAPLGPSESRDILEIVDNRSQLPSTIIASQLPVEDWHASIIDPSVADAMPTQPRSSQFTQNTPEGESTRKVEQRPQRTIDEGT